MYPLLLIIRYTENTYRRQGKIFTERIGHILIFGFRGMGIIPHEVKIGAVGRFVRKGGMARESLGCRNKVGRG